MTVFSTCTSGISLVGTHRCCPHLLRFLLKVPSRRFALPSGPTLPPQASRLGSPLVTQPGNQQGNQQCSQQGNHRDSPQGSPHGSLRTNPRGSLQDSPQDNQQENRNDRRELPPHLLDGPLWSPHPSPRPFLQMAPRRFPRSVRILRHRGPLGCQRQNLTRQRCLRRRRLGLA